MVVVGDNVYFQAMRVGQKSAHGVILVSPATKWKNGRYAQANHAFLEQTRAKDWLDSRKTSILKQIMTSVFTKNPIHRLFRFLDEQTDIWEEVRLLASLPTAPFLSALTSRFGRVIRNMTTFSQD